MALIQCPECGKEISDKAKNCPNCGYVLPHFRKNEKLKRYTKIVGICVISFLVLFLAFLLIKMNIKEHSPFEKFNSKTTKTDVQKIYGKLQSKSNEDNEDIYNVSFVGLKGELYVWYDDDEILKSATWNFQCADGKRQSDYSRQVDKIKKILTKQYGAARKNKTLLKNFSIEWIEWEDTSGQNISLNEDKDAYDICLIYNPQ